MERIIINRIIYLTLVGIITVLIYMLYTYKKLYKQYKSKHELLLDTLIARKEVSKDDISELKGMISGYRELIRLLIFIINGKPALLAKDRLRFTYSVRANGKRVARVKNGIGENSKAITVVGEGMVEVSKGKYVKRDKLIKVLSMNPETSEYRKTKQYIDELTEYTQ